MNAAVSSFIHTACVCVHSGNESIYNIIRNADLSPALFLFLIISIKAAGLLVRVLLFQQFAAAAAIYTLKLNRYIGRLLETDENFGNEPKLFGIRDEFILNHNSDNGFERARTPTNSRPVCTSVYVCAHTTRYEK